MLAAPRLVLWAWSTTDDLAFLAREHRQDIGVAYLSGEILLRPNGLRVQPRLRRLRLPRGVERTAVVYLDVAQGYRTALDAQDVRRIVTRLTALPLVRDADRVQLNFEAVQSRRSLWGALVGELRVQLPARQKLDVAVLADWCLDAGFAPAGVDRVVPMLYRLGPLTPLLSRVLVGSARFPAVACREAVGIATDEHTMVAAQVLAPVRHVYLFSPLAWTSERLSTVEAALAAAAARPPGSMRPLLRR